MNNTHFYKLQRTVLGYKFYISQDEITRKNWNERLYDGVREGKIKKMKLKVHKGLGLYEFRFHTKLNKKKLEKFLVDVYFL